MATDIFPVTDSTVTDEASVTNREEMTDIKMVVFNL